MYIYIYTADAIKVVLYGFVNKMRTSPLAQSLLGMLTIIPENLKKSVYPEPRNFNLKKTYIFNFLIF